MKENKLSLKKIFSAPVSTGLFLFLISIVMIVCVQGFDFFSGVNLHTTITKNAPLIIVAMAQAILMIAGSIDLSIGFQMSLANVVAIMLPQYLGISEWLSWPLAIVAVVIISSLNGLIIGYTRIPPLLATFSMSYVVRGINLLIMPRAQGSISKIIYKTYDSGILGIPIGMFVILIMYFIWYYISKTRTGNQLYATGGNERNAYATGINTAFTKVKAHMIAGVFTAVAGLTLTAITGSGNPITGEAYTLKCIAACIIGGVAFGGWGSIAGAAFGAGFLVIVQNTVFQLFSLLAKVIPGFKLSSYYQSLVSDLIILVGIILTIFTNEENRKAVKGFFNKIFRREEAR